MPKQKISQLYVFDRMIKDDNKGIQMSTTIVKVTDDQRGSIIGFGVENHIGSDAKFQLAGFNGEYMIFCMAVNRKEFEKTRKLMEKELPNS